MKTYVEMDVYTHVFSALVCEWSASRHDLFTPGIEPTERIGYEAGWAPKPVGTAWRSENS
jgi:hypothetical protein